RAAMTSGKSTSYQSTVSGGAMRNTRVSSPAPRSRPTAFGCRSMNPRATWASFLARWAMLMMGLALSRKRPPSWPSLATSSLAIGSARMGWARWLSRARPHRVRYRVSSIGVKTGRAMLMVLASFCCRARRSQSQEPLGVAVGDPFLVGGAHRELVQEGARFGHGRVGVVGGEHDLVGAHLEQQVQEGRGPVEAAEAVVDVLPQIRADRP